MARLIIALVWMQLACSNLDRNQFTSAAISSADQTNKDELNQTLESEIITRDENGNVLAIEGLVYSDNIQEYRQAQDSEGGGDEKLRDIHDSDEKVFEFEPPEGATAEFSEPVMM